jgi:hypothetical protein
MEFLFQRSWHVHVERTTKDMITSSCHYLDSVEEKTAVLQVRVKDFSIEKAELIKLRHAEQFTETVIHIPEMEGVTAYLGSGPELRKALAPLLSSQERELFNQCIIGAFQGETFIFKERGFSTAHQYTQAGEEFMRGTCRYYSNLDRITNSWSDYIGEPERKGYLFNRFKNQQLMATDEEYWLIGSLSDTFHQVNTFLRLRRTDQCVMDARGQLLRAPDRVCRESNSYLQDLTGIDILQPNKKELAHSLGGQSGCVHLIDLIFDSAETLRIYNNTRS